MIFSMAWAISAADIPAWIRSPASMICRPMPVDRLQLSMGNTWPPSSRAASTQLRWELESAPPRQKWITSQPWSTQGLK